MKTRMLFLVALAALVAAEGHAQSKTGTTVAQFLLIEPSARLGAMGNAGVSIPGDITGAYYNPAALGLFPSNGAEFSHSPWLADISYNYAAAAVQAGSIGVFSLGFTSLNSGEIDVRTVGQPLGTGERYTVTSLAIGLGYGRTISENFSAGLQVSWLQETIWHSSLSAFAINVGTIYRISPDGLHIGASISNFGTRAKYDGTDLRIQYDADPERYGDNSALPAAMYLEDYPLPILFRVGVSHPFALGEDHRVLVAADAFHPSDNGESVSLGAEYTALKIISIRGGYQNLFLEDSEVGLTLGAGITYSIDTYALRFDYAWADHGRLNSTQRFTLGVSF
jgi:long-subunit fatty acid transport protein